MALQHLGGLATVQADDGLLLDRPPDRDRRGELLGLRIGDPREGGVYRPDQRRQLVAGNRVVANVSRDYFGGQVEEYGFFGHGRSLVVGGIIAHFPPARTCIPQIAPAAVPMFPAKAA